MNDNLAKHSSAETGSGGINRFIQHVQGHVAETPIGWWAHGRFVLTIAYDYCYICLSDVWNPWQFFKQMSGKPPVRFGKDGFAKELVDDSDPARHYTAFVFIGYWFFSPLAILILWLWEILGFLRYGFTWSQSDIRMGYVGIRHGRQVRRQGPKILPELIAQDLSA